MRIAQWIHRVTRLSVGVPLAWLVLLSSTPSGATDTRQQLSTSRTELEGLCTHKSLQAYAPAGLIIRDIPNVNPALSAAIKIAGGVAYVRAGGLGDGAPEYCVLTGSIVTDARTGKTANFGAALPARTAWRQRLLTQGCGGTCGDVFSNGPPAPNVIQRGYAVWTTDDGHVDSGYAVRGQPFLADSRWAVTAPGQPNLDAIADYADRAVHLATQFGKVFTTRFYAGNAIKHAYFLGCSDGGREAMQEAAKFPEDFDGIVAGAPFLDPSAAVLAGISTQLAQFRTPASAVPAGLFGIVSQAILRKCDATDGVTDGLVQNPAACAFDPVVDIPKCRGSEANGTCLTMPQIEAVAAMLSAVRTESGRIVGPAIGSVSTVRGDSGLASWASFPIPPKSITGPSPFGADPASAGFFWAWPISDGLIRNFTYYADPSYDSFRTLGMRFVEKGNSKEMLVGSVIPDGVARRVQQSLQTLSSPNPYLLASFIAQDRKLIMWHGFADGFLSPYVTIQYYEELAQLHSGYQHLQKNVKLFMAPDVGHCGFGGAGPNAFQSLYHRLPGALLPPQMDAEHDMLMALESWVESHVEPEHIIASKYRDDDPSNPVVRKMPLCQFPTEARYQGSGDVNESSSWSCSSGDQSLLNVGTFGSRAGR
jgi:hypothetical protein